MLFVKAGRKLIERFCLYSTLYSKCHHPVWNLAEIYSISMVVSRKFDRVSFSLSLPLLSAVPLFFPTSQHCKVSRAGYKLVILQHCVISPFHL